MVIAAARGDSCTSCFVSRRLVRYTSQAAFVCAHYRGARSSSEKDCRYCCLASPSCCINIQQQKGSTPTERAISKRSAKGSRFSHCCYLTITVVSAAGVASWARTIDDNFLSNLLQLFQIVLPTVGVTQANTKYQNKYWHIVKNM